MSCALQTLSVVFEHLLIVTLALSSTQQTDLHELPQKQAILFVRVNEFSECSEEIKLLIKCLRQLSATHDWANLMGDEQRIENMAYGRAQCMDRQVRRGTHQNNS